MKRKSTMTIFTLLSFMMTLPTAFAADNPQLITYEPYENKVEYTNGSIYWKTSNIREWLNSNKASVLYTNDPPAYANEIGFLQSFTTAEQNAIAITKRRVHVHSYYQSSVDGGIANVPRYDGYDYLTKHINVASPNLQKHWRNLYYQDINEKVFILSLHELYEYVLKRGWPMEKQVAPAEVTRWGDYEPYYSYVTSTYNFSTTINQMWGILSDGTVQSVGKANALHGIVPALHVQPAYVFSDGRRASTLQIGDTVSFGSYQGDPIQWKVINVTPDGYPLLWATHILTIKAYDGEGEKILKESVSVNFSAADVSIHTDLKYKNQSASPDTTEPSIRVANETDLRTRQNEAFTLIMEARDEIGGSGIDYIVLPDGTRVHEETIRYNVTENGRYPFEVVDKAGNHYGLLLPVGNINIPPDVFIKSSSDGWVNEDVTVEIDTSFQEYTDYIVPTLIDSTSAESFYSGRFSNYTTYANKRYRISGKVKLIASENSPYEEDAGVYISLPYRYLESEDDLYYAIFDWNEPIDIPLSTLKEAQGGFVSFDEILTIDGSYFDNLYANGGVYQGYADNTEYVVEWKDVKVELLDKDEISIEKITLPNGTEVRGYQTYHDVLNQSGNYTYKVVDSRGKETVKQIEVKIDKELPIATALLTPSEFTTGNVQIHFQATDALSKVKRIQKPNGEWVHADRAEYDVSQNAVYTFIAEDFAGNRTTYPVEIATIDREKPLIAFDLSEKDWSNHDILVTVIMDDVGVSGLKDFRYRWTTSATKPTSGWSNWLSVGKNVLTQEEHGTWYLHVEARDYAGNTEYATSGAYKKRNHENANIELNVFPYPTGKWGSQFPLIYINENKNFEPTAEIERKYEVTHSPIMPTIFSKTVPVNQQILLDQVGESYLHIQYTFEGGKRYTKTIGPYLIDTSSISSYQVKILDNNGKPIHDWTNQAVYLSIEDPIKPSLSGYIKQYRIEHYDLDWQTYERDTPINLEGEQRIFARIINQAGTVGEQQMVTAKVDKTPAELHGLTLKNNVNKEYGVTVLAKDQLSGISEVKLSDGTKLAWNGSAFALERLAVKPESVTVTDNAGNVAADILFAPEPSVTFKPPYTLDSPVYRGEVEITLNAEETLKYQIGNKKQDCPEKTCIITTKRNITLTTTNQTGVKQTIKTVEINNINNSELLLLLSGERSANNEKEILFKWNYELTSAKISCLESGTISSFNVTGKMHRFTAAKNTAYECNLTGYYYGEALSSNQAVIFSALQGGVVEEDGMPLTKPNKNVFIEESRIGSSYFIGGKRDNSKGIAIPFPIADFD